MRVIVGCGNLNRSDDGVGVRVVQRLRERLGAAVPPAVRLFDAGTGGMEVMFQARGASRLVIVDACAGSGAPPGALFEVPGAQLEAEPTRSYTLHDFRWDHALAAGRRIFGEQFPRDVTVWLVEAESLALGLDLSAPVAAAAERLVQRLLEEVGTREGSGAAHQVTLVAGSLHLSAELCAEHLAGIDAVALLKRDAALVIVPLARGSAGGLLIKQRNARGDKVIQAQEFCRQHGVPEAAGPRPIPVRWDTAAASLALHTFFTE